MDSIIIPSGYFRNGGHPIPSGSGIGIYAGTGAGDTFLQSSVGDVHNPMVTRNVAYDTIDLVSPEQATAFLSAQQKIRVVSQSELDAYSDVLRQVHGALRGQRPRAVIFPVRGGLKPGLQLEVMGNYAAESLWLPYTTGGSGNHEDAIREALNICLQPFEGTPLRLSVVDTAISGDSASQLAVYLKGWVAKRHDRRLDCHFNLLFDPGHAKHSFPAKAARVPSASSERAQFRLTTFPGPALILEDWAEALGYEVDFQGSRCTIKPSVQSGRAILRDQDGTVSFIEADRLDWFFDQTIAAAVNENILSDPVLQFQRDVWAEYTQR